MHEYRGVAVAGLDVAGPGSVNRSVGASDHRYHNLASDQALSTYHLYNHTLGSKPVFRGRSPTSPARFSGLISGAVLLVMAGGNAVSPTLPLFALSLGADVAGVGLLVSAFFAARILTDLGGAAFADRLGVLRMTFIGCLVLTGFSAAAAVAPTYGTLVIFRLGQGLGMSAALLGSLGHVFQSSSGALGPGVASFQGAQLIGLLIGPLIGGFAAELFGLRYPFWVNAALALAAVALLAPMDKQPAPGLRQGRVGSEPGRLQELLRLPRFQALLLVEMLLFMVRVGVQLTLLPLYAVEAVGISEAQIGQLFALAAAAHLAVIRVAGRVVDRFDHRTLAAAGLLGMSAVVGLHSIADSFGELVLLAIGFGLAGSVAYLVPPVMAGTVGREGSEGLTVGILRAAGSIGSVTGPLLVAGLVDLVGLGGAFLVVAAALATGASGLLVVPNLLRHR